MLDCVEASSVEPDEAGACPEHRPRARREILQPGPDGQDEVGLGRQAVGTVPARDPDGPGPGRVIGEQAALPATVSTTGTRCRSTKRASPASAIE